MTKASLFAAMAFVIGTHVAHADMLTPEKAQNIRALLSENGVLEATRAGFVNSMAAIDIFKGCPQCPANAKEILTRVAADTFTQAMTAPDGLVELLVPIYANHFSDEDVKAWLAFLRSPVGKKVAKEQTSLVSEAGPATNAWIGKLVPIINQKTSAEMQLQLRKNDGKAP